ncbi:Cysteine/Histidine-rich C1 domain family protein [Melia azedarach]|uniref:Cysteine/Histidine-rich C1 domain family protein n=1 Tax=Melia azedarach TaxID=155640 RepID=A0ACC1WTZ1_MELAZ|nr:Cysteine/Histidine-rich C1 domain family protein [Melia azedarach]
MLSSKSFKKTRTFQLQNSPPAPPSKPQRSATFNYNNNNNGTRKSPLREFPTSPQLISGAQFIHFGHPQHALSEIDLPDLFTCAGCKEYGSGKRFTCQQCDFQLHEFCAYAPKAPQTHPLHRQHQLLFFSKPVKGGILKSKCDVCSKPTKGYTFRCSACSFQMHPSCAMLSTEINYPVHPHALKLLTSTPLTNGEPGFVCGECKRKRSGRVYRCTVCEYHLHAVCAKNMVNGLLANNIKGKEKPSALATAARLASQVVKDFIGGLIEGLGEGVGEAFAQNVTRGRGRGVNKRN